MAELQYSERLTILGAGTLELRRLKADIMYIYKILFGLLDVERGTLDIKLKDGTSMFFMFYLLFDVHCTTVWRNKEIKIKIIYIYIIYIYIYIIYIYVCIYI